MNWEDFWHMGGYGFYVWTSWSLTATVMLALVIAAKYRKRKLIKTLSENIRRAAIKAEQQS